MKITVTNKAHGRRTPDTATFYVGRGSVLGNPFASKSGTKANFQVRSREEAIALYEQWLLEQIEKDNLIVLSALAEIQKAMIKHRHVYLECFCAPKDCHANIIKEFLEESLSL